MSKNADYTYPITDDELPRQVARVNAVLPAIGAWDATPVELDCPSFDFLALFMKYTPAANGAANAFDFKIETSLDGVSWYQSTIYGGGTMVVNTDTTSNLQREIFSYGATQQVVAEYIAVGPYEINGAPEKVRIVARESGDAAHPGSLEIVVAFK